MKMCFLQLAVKFVNDNSCRINNLFMVYWEIKHHSFVTVLSLLLVALIPIWQQTRDISQYMVNT